MILFHILMFSQNSTFYIYIIYCQNAPWSGSLPSKNYISLNRWPALKRENWTWSEEKDWQYWTNLFIPLNASQVCLLHGVSWQVFLCVRIKAQSQLHLYRKIISINVWHARNHHVVLISQNRVKSVTQNLLLREYQNSIIFIQKWYVY